MLGGTIAIAVHRDSYESVLKYMQRGTRAACVQRSTQAGVHIGRCCACMGLYLWTAGTWQCATRVYLHVWGVCGSCAGGDRVSTAGHV